MSETSSHGSKNKLAIMAISALGVVYGDIGTSPLYAVREIFFGHRELARSPENVLGAISLIIWAITIIVSFKYVVYVLRADNEGEGGVFALYSLLYKLKSKSVALVCALLVFAAGLLFGDGVITPAISVVSSIEGLTVVTSAFAPYVVPITLLILTLLFAVQSRGTAEIGRVFGPVVLTWFIAISLIGLANLSHNLEVLTAFNPLHALYFLLHHSLSTTMLVLGSVMLVVTGGEAMYADMGHFGRLPIRLSWFAITYPALVLNYLGQGAFLLSNGKVIDENLFFSMVPHWALIPMVVLATAATIIASQALITGAFSLATQAISLRLLPFVKAKHTHHEHEGQIYVPFVNWALYIGCVALVLGFRTSSNLASAYGLAVSGVMVITSLSMIILAVENWHWPRWKAYGLFVPLMLIDIGFLVSNSLKFFAGGFVPVIIALGIYAIMKSWLWGSSKILEKYDQTVKMTIKELVTLKDTNGHQIDKSIVFIDSKPRRKVTDKVPELEQVFWDRYQSIPKHMIFLSVVTKKNPHVEASKRYQVTKFFDDPQKGSISSVVINLGFMEEPNIEDELEGIAAIENIHIDTHPRDWLIHTAHERVIKTGQLSLKERLKLSFFQVISRNSTSQSEYWGLGNHSPLTLQVIPVRLGADKH